MLQAGLQVPHHAPGGLIAILGRLGQKPGDDRAQGGRSQRRLWRRGRDDLVQQLHPVQRAKGRSAFDQHMQDRAQCIKIGPAVGAARDAAGLFGGTEGKLLQGPLGILAARVGPWPQAFGEKCDLQAAVCGAKEHRMRGQLPVVQPCMMQAVNGLGQFDPKPQRFHSRRAALAQQFRKRGTRRRLHQQRLGPPPHLQPQGAQKPEVGLFVQAACQGHAPLEIRLVLGAGGKRDQNGRAVQCLRVQARCGGRAIRCLRRHAGATFCPIMRRPPRPGPPAPDRP